MDIPTVNVTIRVKTQHIIIPGPTVMDGLPPRRWRVELCMLDESENEMEPVVLSNCTFQLHPTFKDPIRQITAPPFALEEEGWGQFDLKIICRFIENGGKFTVRHFLSFQDSAYAMDYSVQIPYHIPKLRELLAPHFSLPQKAVVQFLSEQNVPVVGNWISSLPYLDEDAVLHIVQMVVSHPALQDEIYKHPSHEDFLMCLYQLPNDLLRQIGDYVSNGLENGGEKVS